MNINIQSTDEELRKLFSWQARVGIAPKFGTRPIGWYQQHHCNVHKFLLSMAARIGSYEATMRKGSIYLGTKRVGSVDFVYEQGDTQ